MTRTARSHLQALRRSRNAWIGFTLFASVVVCAAIATMYSLQSQALSRAASLAEELRLARADLVNGFMHAALGGAPGSPWDRDAGLVLMQQGVREFEHALPRLGAARRTELMERELAQFAHTVARDPKAPGPTAVELRVAFYQLDRLSAAVDRDAQAEVRRLQVGQKTTFWLVLVGSGLLLGFVTIGAVRAAAREVSALAARREADARFSQLADNIRDVFWVRDPQSGHFLFVNAAYEPIWGRPLGDLTRNPDDWLDGIHPDDRSRVAGLARGVVDRGFELEYRVLRPDGTVRWIRDRGVPVRDQTGRTRGMAGIAEDITTRKEMEARLLDNERRLRSIIDLVPHAIHAKDRDGRFLLVNQAAADWLHCSTDQLIGHRPDEFGIDPSDAEQDRRIDAEVLASGQRFSGPASYRRVGGVDVAMIVHKMPFNFAGGDADAVLGVSIDVTELQNTQDRLRETVVLLQATLQSTDNGVMVAAPDGQLLLWNERLVQLLGDASSLASRSEAKALAEIGEGAACAQEGESTQVVRRADGRFLERHAQPMLIDGRLAGTVWTVRDVTAREQASIDAFAREEELERRVGERTHELVATCQELEAFTSAVSHDVRTPLAGIRAFAEVLSRKHSQQLAPEGREYVAHIVTASEAMQEMIRGLLDLSRHALAPMHRRPLDLSRMAREAYALHSHVLGGRKAEFLVQDGLQATGDPTLVATLLQNLIGNAIKYSRHSDPARIEIGATVDGETPRFYVRDNGAGFDPASADRLFQPFSRLHKEEDFEGHGIGLATCSRIVAKHAGAIWAEGAPGRGATFHFTLGGD